MPHDEPVTPREREHDRRKLAYEDIVRSLQRQATVLAELRGRANILLAANAVVASLFGPNTLKNPHPLLLAIASLAAFAAGVVCCIAVLWAVHDSGDILDPEEWRDQPRWPSDERPRKWRVTFSPDQVLDFLEFKHPGAAILHNPDYKPFRLARKTNHRTISARTRYFQAACILLALQIGLWAWLVFAQPGSPTGSTPIA